MWCFVFPIHNFQIVIVNGGMMKCGGWCENVKLQMDKYNLKMCVFTINMSDYDVVISIE